MAESSGGGFSVGNYADLINNLNDKIATATPKATFPDLFDAYFGGKNEAYKQRNQDAFKNGVPKDAAGNPDYSAIFSKAAQAGGTSALQSAVPLAGLDLQQRKMLYQGRAAAEDFPGASQPIISSLGSPSTATAIRKPPPEAAGFLPPPPPSSPAQTGGNRFPAVSPASPGGDNGINTIASIVSKYYPAELAGPIINNFADRMRADPNGPIADPAALQRLDAAVQRMAQARNGGSQAGPPVPDPRWAPQAAPQASSGAPAPFDPTLGGLVPAGRTPQQQIDGLTRRIASGLLEPDVAKAYQARIEAIKTALEPTPDMKNFRAYGQPGETMPAFEARVAGARLLQRTRRNATARNTTRLTSWVKGPMLRFLSLS